MKVVYARALSNYVLMMSEQVVELPFGWATVRCCDGIPADWMCLHIHDTEDGARTCMERSMAERRGIFPIR
jgi:hypothetical protein